MGKKHAPPQCPTRRARPTSTACGLSTSPGAPGPHDFAVRIEIATYNDPTASIASRLVTIAIRPRCRGGIRQENHICEKRKWRRERPRFCHRSAATAPTRLSQLIETSLHSLDGQISRGSGCDFDRGHTKNTPKDVREKSKFLNRLNA